MKVPDDKLAHLAIVAGFGPAEENALCNLLKRDRRRKTVVRRWFVMSQLHQEGYSKRSISLALRRDMATVIYGLRQWEKLDENEKNATN